MFTYLAPRRTALAGAAALLLGAAAGAADLAETQPETQADVAVVGTERLADLLLNVLCVIEEDADVEIVGENRTADDDFACGRPDTPRVTLEAQLLAAAMRETGYDVDAAEAGLRQVATLELPRWADRVVTAALETLLSDIAGLGLGGADRFAMRAIGVSRVPTPTFSDGAGGSDYRD